MAESKHSQEKSRKALQGLARKQNPVSLHRGLPVYLVPKEMMVNKKASHSSLGRYTLGSIWINADTRALPKKFREVVMEHEFGETWSHDFGQIIMVQHLIEKGLLDDFIEYYKRKNLSFIKREEIETVLREHPGIAGRKR